MSASIGLRIARLALLSGTLFALCGCYYMQAASGQLEVMRKREPIADVIADENTSPELSARLRLIEDARRFSITELGLPDNDSYRSFADLERKYVVWNVVAVPELSMEPKQWCYPIVGCVSYRGYFSESKARRLGEKLDADGYDVLVGGVAAYSTLGRFDDPILNTMMHWNDVDLVAVMFHELAHQVLYIKDDSGFNESFATAVEEFGIERWLADRGAEADVAAYYERRNLQRTLMRLVAIARDDLDAVYRSSAATEEIRQYKRQRLEQLTADAAKAYSAAEKPAPRWWSDDLNNARLASMTLYHGLLPAFRALLAECEADLQCFYAQAEAISELEPDARSARLAALEG